MSYIFTCLQDDEMAVKLVNYLKEQTGCNDVILEGNGYVDHGYEHIEYDFDWLVNFMFNLGGEIHTGNDND